MKRMIIPFAIFAFALSVWIVNSEYLAAQVPSPPNKTRWEYKIISGSDVVSPEEINKLGEDGWEIFFIHVNTTGNNSNPIAYMKRMKN